MTNGVLPDDGVIKGVFNNFKGTEASVKAVVSCKGKEPVGKIDGKVQFAADDGVLQHYKFWSNYPVFVKTSKFHVIKHLKVVLKDVGLKNIDTDTVIEKCIATLAASQFKPNTWNGFLTVVTPAGKKITVCGAFSGNIIVKHSGTCKKHPK